jgi:uncharacterized membrane protein HdeD (DUF308 family)
MLTFVPVWLNWRSIALRGLIAALLGVLTLLWPVAALRALLALLGACALIDAAFALRRAVFARWLRLSWWPPALRALVSGGAAVAAFVLPDATALAVLDLVAAWFVVAGIADLLAAFSRRERPAEGWFALSGAAGVLLGVLLLASPPDGLLALAWLLGLCALVVGGGLLGLALWLRAWQRRLERCDWWFLWWGPWHGRPLP